jgi:hypothetical protein
MCLDARRHAFGDRQVGTTADAIGGHDQLRRRAVHAHRRQRARRDLASAFHVASTCTTGARSPAARRARSTSRSRRPSPARCRARCGSTTRRRPPASSSRSTGAGSTRAPGSASLTITPAPLDFGAQAIGVASPARALTLYNNGPAPLHFTALVLNGPAAYDFDFSGNCGVGMSLPAGRSCQLAFTFTPATLGTRPAQLNIDAPELARLATVAVRGTGVAAGPVPVATPPPVDVVEFYNAPLNHWFLTANADEAAAIDRGAVGPNWVRTGLGFRAYAAASTGGGAVDVCRFFGTPGVGPSSHFFTGNAAECAAVRANPYWLDEGIAFRAIVPAGGACPAGSAPVIRFFWPGGYTLASRHRYSSDAATIAALRADAAWIEEGPVFCSAP